MAYQDSAWYKVGRTLLKTFVAAVVGQLVVFGTGILNLSMVEWKAVVAAGIAAVVLAGYNALNPGYSDYGVGHVSREDQLAQEEEVFEEDIEE